MIDIDDEADDIGVQYDHDAHQYEPKDLQLRGRTRTTISSGVLPTRISRTDLHR